MSTDLKVQSVFATLHKILRAESDSGFQNTGVIGGLDKMIPLWESQVRNYRVSDDVCIKVSAALRKYPLLSIDERKLAINKLSKILNVSVSDNPADHIPQPSPSNPRHPDPGVSLDSSLSVINGIGRKQSERLEKLGLHSLRDAISFYPHRYLDYSALKPISHLEFGEDVTVIGSIKSSRLRKLKGGRTQIVLAIIGDGTGEIECSWFNQPWLQKQLRPGLQVQLSGRPDMYLGKLVFANPDWEEVDNEALHTGRIVPIHHLTKGISAKNMRRWLSIIVDYSAPYIQDPLPIDLRARLNLPDLQDALKHVHFPETQIKLSDARRRLAFDELFVLQLGMRLQRAKWQSVPGQLLQVDDEWLSELLTSLPFALTGAQQRTWGDVQKDLSQEVPMNRLLQGDVGSGKTVIAALALAVAVRCGVQGTIMAPTSVLAEQHYRSVSSLLEGMPGLDLGGDDFPAVRLLLGSTPAAERSEIDAGLRDGSIKVLIGTHAIIQELVEFADLGVAVVDEQHRFGVEQRAALRGKGANPHLLVMTATPIPRSLALTVYGDLDVTILDEFPAGRKPVETRVIYPSERERAYSFVRSQVAKGRQVFMIFPLVEESATLQLKAAVEEHARLKKDIFPDLRLGLLHGRIKPREKDAVMESFRCGELDVLVATSVVEVGVDVPNASVMLIEGANRFGLAQLHQFRGRVGRGEHKSFCILVSNVQNSSHRNVDNKSGRRLKLMETISDGFTLAEKDLELRGPGAFLGTRQAGYDDLQLARLTDLHMINLARREADKLVCEDPNYTKPEHQLLLRRISECWKLSDGDVS